MKTQFEQMMDGLNDVEAFLAGEQEGFKAHVPQEVDVKAIRNRLGMTQARFSNNRHRQKSRCRAYRTESRCVRCRCRLF